MFQSNTIHIVLNRPGRLVWRRVYSIIEHLLREAVVVVVEGEKFLALKG
jgi:hypothetical protein